MSTPKDTISFPNTYCPSDLLSFCVSAPGLALHPQFPMPSHYQQFVLSHSWLHPSLPMKHVLSLSSFTKVSNTGAIGFDFLKVREFWKPHFLSFLSYIGLSFCLL
jgi:hypothetical protein